MAVKKNTNSGGYSDEALLALKRGTYGKETNRSTRYTTSQDQLQQVKQLPTLKPASENKVKERNNAVKPSTRYQNTNKTQSKQSDRDTRYDKDFDYFYDYRVGDFSGEVDYDPVSDTDVEKWRNVKKDIMKKNNWTDKEFDDRYSAYENERYKNQLKTDADLAAKFASEHPVLGTIAQAAQNPGVWFEGAANMISSLLPEKYKAKSTDDSRFYSLTQKNAMKQAVKDNMNSDVGKTAYDIGTGLGDMVLASGVPVLGVATLGTEAASRNQMQALERGVDPTRAAATGALSGVVSGVMNKIGLEKALGSAGQTVAGTIGKAAVKEGAENLLEDSANLAIDKFINKDKSQLDTLHDYYVLQGMTDEDAWSQVARDTGADLATSFGSGAAFGGFMSGLNNLPTLTGMLKNHKANIQNIDPEIQNAIETTEATQAEIQNLQNQLPKVEAQSAPKITLTPEESARLQQSKPVSTETQGISNDELAELNKEFGNMWADEPKAETAPTNPVENKTVNESAPIRFNDMSPKQQAEIEAEMAEQYSFGKQKNVPNKTNKVSEIELPTNKTEAYNNTVTDISPKQSEGGTITKNIASELQKENFRPITFTTKDGSTYIISKSTRPGEKWQLSHIDDTGDAIGHTAFANDADLISKIQDAENAITELNPQNNIFTQSTVTINDMLKNPDAYTLEDFDRAYRSFDKNADTDGASKEDLIDALNAQVAEEASVGTISVKAIPQTNSNYKIGDKITYVTDDFEGHRELQGTIKESYPDHVIVDVPDISDHVYIDNDMMDMLRPAEEGFNDGQLTPEEVKVLQDAANGKSDIPETGNPAPKKDSIPDDIRAYMNNKLAMIQKIQNDARKGVNGLEIMKTTDDFNRYEADLINKYPNWFDNGSFKEADYNRLMRMEEAAKKAAKAQKKTSKPKEMPTVKPTEQAPANTPKQNGPDVKNIKNSFRGKIRYINDSNNEYAKQFIKALDEFEKAPSEATYQKVKKAHEDYAANSGSKNMKNWYGTWYTKTYEPDGINKQLDSLAEKYGIKTGAPKNEVPNVKKTEPVNNEVPKVKPNEPTPPKNTPPNEPPKTNLSKRYETLKNSDLFKKSEANMKMLETSKEKGVFDKDIESRKEAQEEALKEYLADPEKAREHNLNKKWDSGKDVDTSMLILKDALEKGDQAETNLTLLKQVEMNKGAGRQLRANRDYAGTKEKTLQKAAEFMSDKADKVLSNKKSRTQYEAMVERIVNGDLSELSSKLKMDEADIDNIKKAIKAGAGKADIVKMIGMYQAVGKTGISADTLKKVSEIYSKIEEGNYGLNSRKRAELETDAFKVLAQDIGGKRTWREKWDAWRYLAMLGNPKTHLRNILGNTTHYMITEAKDNLAGALETALDKVSKNGIERTKAILTADDDGLVKRSAQDADDNAYASLNDSGSKYNVKDEINRARDSFNSKTLSKIDEFNSGLLDKEDYSALKRKYSKSLARYLKANGANESIFDATDDASKALLDKARVYAIDQAKQATFHEYSKLAETLTNASRNLANSDKVRDKAASYVLEGLLPFKKTPINILKQGGKYSPISLAKGLYKAFDAVKTGNSTASEAIDDLASGLTGSAIMALGGFLASKGMLTGSADDNYDVDNAEKDQGKQNYALKIGDSSYTLDWLAPASMPLFVGVELYKQMQKKDKNLDVNDFLSALTTIAEPITEMSMLQGINDTLEQLSYSGLKSAVGTFAASTGLGYITQGVPTIAGQVARAVDNTRRSTYSDKTGAEKQIDRAVTKVKNKIPVVSSSSEPYIDAKGRVEKNEGFFASKLGNGILPNLMDQMLSPGYYKQGTVSTVDKELNRLYEATGESPYLNVSSGKVNKEQLSKSDFTKYQTQYGQTNTKLYTDIIGSDEYKQLDDAQRLKILDSAKDMSKMIADHEIGGKELSDSQQKLYDTYKKEGLNSISSRLKEQAKVGAINDKYGTEMRLDTYEKWSTDPELKKLGGPEAYAKNYAKAKELDMDVKTYIKKEAEAPGTAAKEVQMKEDAVDNGFVTKDGKGNLDAYTKAVDMFGEDQKKIQAYSTVHSKGYTKNSQLLPELVDNSSFNDEDRGKILMSEHGKTPDKLGKTAKGAYDVGGYAGVYYYWMLKQLADTNNNGSVDKKEKKALMNSDNKYVMQVPDNIYKYLDTAKW